MAKTEKNDEYVDLIMHHNEKPKRAPEPKQEPEDPEGMIPHN